MNNKIPCGGFYLSDTLGVDENGKLGINGGEPYKSLVTDGEGNVKWADRLAYEETEVKEMAIDIVWDGNTEGLVASSRNNYYKVFDTAFTLDQFKQMNYVVNGEDNSVAVRADEGGINSSSGIITVYDGTSAPVIVSQEAVDSGANVPAGAPDTFPESGVYFPVGGGVSKLYSDKPVTLTFTKLKQIDEKFIPKDFVVNISYENGGFTADKTYNEIVEAINSGKTVYAKQLSGQVWCPLVSTFLEQITFFNLSPHYDTNVLTKPSIDYIIIKNNNTVEIFSFTLTAT